MRYKITFWKDNLIRLIIKTDCPIKVNLHVKKYKSDCDLIEVFECGSLERKVYEWNKWKHYILPGVLIGRVKA